MRALCFLTFLGLFTLYTADVPANEAAENLPAGFVYADQVIPDLHVNLRYRGSDNFMGKPIDGYQGNRLILTHVAATALAKVQAALRPMGLSLLVYDGYRPQRAVDHFARWAMDPDDAVNKAEYYPDVDKSELFAKGYIADRSGHTRGSAIDLTLADAATGTALDMGTPWDFLGPESWPDYAGVTPQQRANRLLLSALMSAHGFTVYPQEWWHFFLDNEPFPDTYFDFVVQ
jgi:D-alanyl-D-alanine dipeptidase